MAIEIEKLDDGYFARVGYPESVPARRQAFLEPGLLIREVLIWLRLMETYEDVTITISRKAYDDYNGHHPATTKVL